MPGWALERRAKWLLCQFNHFQAGVHRLFIVTHYKQNITRKYMYLLFYPRALTKWKRNSSRLWVSTVHCLCFSAPYFTSTTIDSFCWTRTNNRACFTNLTHLLLHPLLLWARCVSSVRFHSSLFGWDWWDGGGDCPWTPDWFSESIKLWAHLAAEAAAADSVSITKAWVAGVRPLIYGFIPALCFDWGALKHSFHFSFVPEIFSSQLFMR